MHDPKWELWKFLQYTTGKTYVRGTLVLIASNISQNGIYFLWVIHSQADAVDAVEIL